MLRSLLAVDPSVARELGVRPEAPSLPAVLAFGGAEREVRAAREGAALLDATDRGALCFEGADASSFLHRILASDVRALAPGRGQRSLLLSGKGRVRYDFELGRTPAGYVAATPPAASAGLFAALDHYLFGEDVRIEDATERCAPLELVGPRARHVLERVLGDLPELLPGAMHTSSWREAACALSAVPVAGAPGWRVDVGPERARELFHALREAGAEPTGIRARERLRIEAGAPLFGIEIDEDVYPQEVGLDLAFSLAKGCYVGQEVVAKIDTYGGLQRRLVGLATAAAALAPGTRLLTVGGGEPTPVGVVRSWTPSSEGGRALALVRRGHQEPGTALLPEGSSDPARVVALPDG